MYSSSDKTSRQHIADSLMMAVNHRMGPRDEGVREGEAHVGASQEQHLALPLQSPKEKKSMEAPDRNVRSSSIGFSWDVGKLIFGPGFQIVRPLFSERS